MKKLGQERMECSLHSDSQSAIHLAKNSARMNHIGIKYHSIRSLLEEDSFKLDKIHTDENPTGMLTKSVTTVKLEVCSTSRGLTD